MGSENSRGKKSVAQASPTLVSEWHPSKNGELTPDDVSWGSARKIWWLCSKGHEWEASPNVRSRPQGCPVCAGQKLLVGLNDMATTHPELSAQWHPSKNGELSPGDVFASTGKKIWWECEQGHEYETSGNARASKSSGCPYCAGKLILVGFNDMATTHPGFAAQWHPTKNGDLTPMQVFAGGGRKIWWLCAEGHEWEASGNQRGTDCPVCSGKKIVSGVNDLATLRPDLAAQWHPTKNGDLSAKEISPWSNAKIWWKCADGHEWLAAGNQRMGGTQCPICATFGFDPSKPSILYFLSHSEKNARKVGITNAGTTRLRDFKRQGWTALKTLEHPTGYLMREVERHVLSWIRNDLGLPAYLTAKDMRRLGGWSETFSMEGPSDHDVWQKVQVTFEELRPSF